MPNDSLSPKLKAKSPSIAFFLLILLACYLSACTGSSRERSKIPPPPLESDKLKEAAAIETLLKAISANRSVPDNYYKLAIIYTQKGQYIEALKYIKQADVLQPNHGKFLLQKAIVLLQLNQINESYQNAQQAKAFGIDSPQLYTLLGYLSQAQSKFLEADAYLAKSLQMAPYEAETYDALAKLTARRGDTTLAISYWEKGLVYRASYLPIYEALTTISAQTRNYGTALSYNQAGLRIAPNSVPLLVARAKTFQRISMPDSSLFYYERIIAIDKEHKDALLSAAAIYYRWGNYTKALRYYEVLGVQNQEDAKINYLIGICYEKLGNLAKAEEFFAIAAQYQNAEANQSLENLKNRQQQASSVATPIYGRASKETIVQEYALEEPIPRLDTTKVKLEVLKPRNKIISTLDSVLKIRH